MADRFFVKVFAADPATLRRLRDYELDLFKATAREREGDFAIDGLLTLDDVGRLVHAGYRVLVEEHSSKRARATAGTVGFREWLQGMGV